MQMRRECSSCWMYFTETKLKTRENKTFFCHAKRRKTFQFIRLSPQSNLPAYSNSTERVVHGYVNVDSKKNSNWCWIHKNNKYVSGYKAYSEHYVQNSHCSGGALLFAICPYEPYSTCLTAGFYISHYNFN